MILDNNLQLSGSVSGNTWTGQLVTSTGNTVSTNVIDMASMSPNQATDVGAGESLDVVIDIRQALTSGGAATIQFQLVQADDAAISSNVQVINQTDAFAYNSTAMAAGKRVILHYDTTQPLTPKRYVALRYVVGTAALTNATGQFTAAVVKNPQFPQQTYASGFAIL